LIHILVIKYVIQYDQHHYVYVCVLMDLPKENIIMHRMIIYV